MRIGYDQLPPNFKDADYRDVTWGVIWCCAPPTTTMYLFELDIASDFQLKQAVPYVIGGRGATRVGVYKLNTVTNEYDYVDQSNQELPGDWFWQGFSFNYPDGITLTPGKYRFAVRPLALNDIYGVPVFLDPANTGAVMTYLHQPNTPFPDPLPVDPNQWNWNGTAIPSFYITDEEAPYPMPPRPTSTRIISTIKNKKSGMRGYGGFTGTTWSKGRDLWTTENYRIVRMQCYGEIGLGDAGESVILNRSYWLPPDGECSWDVIETFLSDVAMLRQTYGQGVPCLSLWIHNFDEDAIPYTERFFPGIAETYMRGYGDHATMVAFFQKLKGLMEKYNIPEMIFEPAWEFNHSDQWPVSPAQQRGSRILSPKYAYGMAAIRLARDEVRINASILSHILAVHGDMWYDPIDPTRETWKRSYVKDWFIGMQFADIVTVSCYLKDTAFSADTPSTAPRGTSWEQYLPWIYTYVLGLQKVETGWGPAEMVGTSEHNLNTDGTGVPFSAFDLDFQLFAQSGLSVLGWWRPFSDASITQHVNSLARQLQEITTPVSPLSLLIRAALSAATGVGLIWLSM